MLPTDPSALNPIESIAHIIQTALTPVFLLSGIAALLNVFSSRLARVADLCRRLGDVMETASGAKRVRLERQFQYLHRRSLALDAAVLLGTGGGVSTCGAALLLFLGSFRSDTVTSLLYGSFGLALICTMGALAAFLVEMLMASHGLREQQADAVRRARRRPAKANGAASEDTPGPDGGVDDVPAA